MVAMSKQIAVFATVSSSFLVSVSAIRHNNNRGFLGNVVDAEDSDALQFTSLIRKEQDGSITKLQDASTSNYNFDGDFKIKGHALLLDQPSSTVGHNYGRSVWEGGIVMAKFLEKQVTSGSLKKDKVRGLEFGSGTGVGGLSLALAGADVILTDKTAVNGETLPTEDNLKKNLNTIKTAGGSAQFKGLDWAQLPSDKTSFLGGPVDVIFGSDLFGSWSTDPEGPSGCPHCGRLADAISWAADSSPDAKIFFSYTKRESNALDIFTKELQKHGLSITKKEDAEGAAGGNIFMLYIGKAAASGETSSDAGEA